MTHDDMTRYNVRDDSDGYQIGDMDITEMVLASAYDQQGRQLAEAQALIAEFHNGAVETLKKWYAEKQRADQAEAERDVAHTTPVSC